MVADGGNNSSEHLVRGRGASYDARDNDFEANQQNMTNNLMQKYFKIIDNSPTDIKFQRPIEFKTLYWMIFVSVGFITLSYWMTATHTDIWNDDDSFSLLLILLRYVPTILLNLTYVLIYFQMQNLFVISRVQSSN